jgi:hypothetical protein
MAAITPDDSRDDSGQDRRPARPPGSARSADDIAELAATGGALVTALVAQRWNEAGRSWWQRRIGAMPLRQAREETVVRIGALLGGTLTYLLATGATEGLHRLHDRKQQRAVVRSVAQILTAAATAPDGSVPAEASLIVETALMGLGVSARTRKRLLAGPRPGPVSDLGACPLPEPLLSTVAVIAFSAMVEAADSDEAFAQTPVLLRRMGLARPAAEAKASEIRDDYNSTYLVLSDLAARLRPEKPERHRRLRPPVARMTAVGAVVHQRNPSEVSRQLTRQAAVTLLRYGTRATVSAGVPLHPAVRATARLVAQILGEETPALPARSVNSPPVEEG